MKYHQKPKEYPLREKREELGLSQRELGRELDMDFTHISKLEREKYVAKPETAQKIIDGITNLIENDHEQE